MIIDCHGHYTTEPKDLHRFRKDQTEAVKNKTALPPRAGLKISDDEIRESLEANQIRLQKERGTDLTIFSPRASGMGHHVGDEAVSLEWTAICRRSRRYCRQSRRTRMSYGLCSISNTTPSNFAVLIANAESTSAGWKHVKAGCPASSARITPLRRGRSAIPLPLYGKLG